MACFVVPVPLSSSSSTARSVKASKVVHANNVAPLAVLRKPILTRWALFRRTPPPPRPATRTADPVARANRATPRRTAARRAPRKIAPGGGGGRFGRGVREPGKPSGYCARLPRPTSGCPTLPANLCPFCCSGANGLRRPADDSLVALSTSESKGYAAGPPRLLQVPDSRPSKTISNEKRMMLELPFGGGANSEIGR
jgi:hypothetical protein